MRRSLTSTARLAVTAALAAVLTTGGAASAAHPARTARPAALPAAPTTNRPWVPADGVRATHPGGNTIGTQVREAKPRKDGYRHIDTPRLIKRLKELHVNTFYYTVWDMPTDWADLKDEFAPAAQRAGIRVWVGLAPPSECFPNDDAHLAGRCSRPYETDFLTWADQVARLSKTYSNVVAWAIDDFLASDNAELFTHDYLSRMRQITKSINPDLGLYTIAYYGTATNPGFYATYGDVIDGVVYPYLGKDNNTNDASAVAANLDAIRTLTEQKHLSLILLDYSGRLLDSVLAPTARYVNDVLDVGMRYTREHKIDGVISYGTQLTGENLTDPSQGPRQGDGRLALTVAPHVGTRTGDYAEASQEVTVDPTSPRYELSWWHRDPFYGGLGGYHFKQVLIDDQVIWESDVTDWFNFMWINGSDRQGPVDVTQFVKGKKKVKLSFRLYERQGVGDYYTDATFDDLSSIGLDIRDPGFEHPSAWQISGNSDHVNATVHVYHHDEPERIFRTVARQFARH
ncbi:hypothetical protein [Actinoallomurus iriomotensis]|uniref:Uncharacterized protein n=1 Tax=Actinoallomurus iriomotensis TaxID=478107 RepID=A0A9W6RA28_9ACTN|nr:hypothetical protein [Actinoallomurus iriomotensis]GLY71743.1 hypothetical protein Airi01_000100 [Actinoallomurus iriomotensis]